MKRQFEVFLPSHKVVRQWSDRKKTLDVPLFPNYVFVRTTLGKMWSALNIGGASRIITFDGVPAVVSDREIQVVKTLLCYSAEIKNEEGVLCLKGEKVRVKEGPFTGFQGEVLNKKSTTRLYIELQAINRIVSIEIDAALLEKISYSDAGLL